MEMVVFYAQIVSIPLEIVSFGYRTRHNHSILREICTFHSPENEESPLSYVP